MNVLAESLPYGLLQWVDMHRISSRPAQRSKLAKKNQLRFSKGASCHVLGAETDRLRQGGAEVLPIFLPLNTS